MRRIIPILITAAVVSGLWSCNEKPRHYKFVKRTMDNTEQVETFEAKNDTDALNTFIDRMSAIVVENLNKNAEPFKDMYVISPEGDTLNKNKELLEYVATKSTTAVPSATSIKQDTIILGKIPAAQ